MSGRKLKLGLYFLCAICAISAFALHAPGQLSFDTTVQLFEASTHHSVSWQPPLLSALFAWLGGGLLATGIFVAVNCFLTYAAFAAFVRQGGDFGWARALICAALILNPVVFSYVGIVWKDVLFATWMVGTLALCLAAERASDQRVKRFTLVLICIILGAGSLIRQQGVLLGPLLMLAPLGIIVRSSSGTLRVAQCALAIVLYVVCAFLTSLAANATIAGNGGRDLSVAPGVIESYDIAGIVARLPTDVALRTIPGLTPQDDANIRSEYTSARADFLNPAGLQGRLPQQSGMSLQQIWVHAVSQYPLLYLRHRAALMAYVLSARDVTQCLPTHVGIQGGAEYLKADGLKEETNARASFLYKGERFFIQSPLWRHWIYLIVLAVCTLVALFARSTRGRPTLLVFAFTLWVFVAGFIPTAIACDFRYLYPIIPPILGMAIVLLTGRAAPSARP
ncbi:hypothetical protein C7401_109153 [Paraburkholderia unamae]|uniref:hypothetical protein n=1 Tax=Paraburkholderia unamae TaxID=219649 RepID=UPI000DC46880|nr:hypothetical protein [Paraburkholderia unamae]RAR60630.1 hypothetical protein C7401_109153 [Paraburkholderia unamae]